MAVGFGLWVAGDVDDDFEICRSEGLSFRIATFSWSFWLGTGWLWSAPVAAPGVAIFFAEKMCVFVSLHEIHPQSDDPVRILLFHTPVCARDRCNVIRRIDSLRQQLCSFIDLRGYAVNMAKRYLEIGHEVGKLDVNPGT